MTSGSTKESFQDLPRGFVALSVPDLDASAGWYASKLDLRVVKHALAADKKSAVTILEGSVLSVELIWLAHAVPLSKITPELKGTHELNGIFKSGVYVQDLDLALRTLRERNVTFAFEPFFDTAMRCRMFAIRDNNGNILQFFGK